MHDLAISVARLENITFGINGENIGEKTHHVSFGFNLGSSLKIPTMLFKANRMRTFFCQVKLGIHVKWYGANHEYGTNQLVIHLFQVLSSCAY